MKLSILDQAPISAGHTAQDALYQSVKLAQAGEKLGYTRFWVAEHHDLRGLACSAPEVMLSYIGAHTKTIRIGSGAVLLPHYKPFKVAEMFNMLATLFPNRIDIGIGRAPGGSAQATEALSNQYLKQVWSMPKLVEELLHFLKFRSSQDYMSTDLQASPIPDVSAEPWLLGTSKKSAILAAENGMSYAFGQFMSDSDGPAIIQKYRDAFQTQSKGHEPQVLVTVSAICAETTEKAEEIALSSLIWNIQKEKGEDDFGVPSIRQAQQYRLSENETDILEKMKRKIVIGNPSEVKKRLEDIKTHYRADEIMLVTITHNIEDRVRSYELIAKELL